ncbi:hypothetical protein OAO01_00870 [Oligoflexia bacterium]|nr:hypothetical protein [Oligoflexia bacterium]
MQYRILKYRILKYGARHSSYFTFTLAALIFTTSLLLPISAYSQKRPVKKNLNDSFESVDASTYDFSFTSAFDSIIGSSTDTDLYEPLTIGNLRRLKDRAQPAWNPDDIDPYRTRRVVEKAFAIQTGRNLNKLLIRSELRDVYREIKQGLVSFRNLFRYSLQTDGSSYQVSKKNVGKKLLELNLEFNAHQGVDPQIKIGELIRFRYDYVQKRPLLEYGFDF